MLQFDTANRTWIFASFAGSLYQCTLHEADMRECLRLHA